jgi:hypothetical protein
VSGPAGDEAEGGPARRATSGPPLSGEAAARWAEYRAAVTAGLPRARIRGALERLIAALDDAGRAALTAWFCRTRYDQRSDVDLTDRAAIGLLTRAVLVPALVAGARARDPDHLRWLAHAMEDPRLALTAHAPALGERSRPEGILAAALAANPGARGLWRLAFWRELDVAYWGGHHMGDGALVLPEDRCRASLVDARQLMAAAPEGTLDPGDVAALAALEAVYAAFFAWRDAGRPGRYAGPIPEWVPAIPPRPR